MTVVSTGIPAVGPPATAPPRVEGGRDTPRQETVLASAFYPFAAVSITESRRQVEQAEAFSEQQSLRRSKEREEARDASTQEEATFRGIVEDRRSVNDEEDVAVKSATDETGDPEFNTPGMEAGNLGLDVLA